MTTTNLAKLIRPRAWYDLSPPAAASICVFALLLVGMVIGRIKSAPAVQAQPTPALAPIILIATQPALVPTAAAQVAVVPPGNVTQHAIGVFGGPDTASYIGAVEAGRRFTPVGRYAEWVQVDMENSGRVFVRAADLFGIPDLVDLQPAPTPIVVHDPIYVQAPAPAVDTPEPYTVASEPPPACASERQCAIQGRLANEHQPDTR